MLNLVSNRLCVLLCIHQYICMSKFLWPTCVTFSEINCGGRLESLEIKRNSDTQQCSGWVCATPFHVPHSGFIKYWLHWKPLLRVKGPQTKSRYFYLLSTGTLLYISFLMLPCNLPWIPNIEMSFTSCILTCECDCHTHMHMKSHLCHTVSLYREPNCKMDNDDEKVVAC